VEILSGVGLELLETAGTAEEIGLTLMDNTTGAFRWINGHTANRVHGIFLLDAHERSDQKPLNTGLIFPFTGLNIKPGPKPGAVISAVPG
jgi:hypothetical protein